METVRQHRCPYLDQSVTTVVRCSLRWFVRVVDRASLDQSATNVRAVLVLARR